MQFKFHCHTVTGFTFFSLLFLKDTRSKFSCLQSLPWGGTVPDNSCSRDFLPCQSWKEWVPKPRSWHWGDQTRVSFFIVVWSWLPENHPKASWGLLVLCLVWRRKMNRWKQSCRVLCDGLGKVVLLSDLCRVCALHLLNEQDSSDLKMMFGVITPWLKFTEAEISGDLLSFRLWHSCWNPACFTTFSECKMCSGPSVLHSV